LNEISKSACVWYLFSQNSLIKWLIQKMYFTVLFTDFDRVAFHQALLDYQKRDRRFGQIATSA